MRRVLVWLGVVSALASIWFGGPMTGLPELADERVRLAVMAAVLAVFGVTALLRRVRRRSAAKAIERALMRNGTGDDSPVLADRMSDALKHLKKSGGSGYLYDLPWYVIIGPPGAGKTTALLNSGLRFPVGGDGAGAIEGFGGTRYCDWWFSDDAVLVDTAGRYTSQDSDAKSDGASWLGFLKLLKKSRPKQPINGVILAISAEDIMRGTPDSLARHAETVRARLAEMQATLRIDLPVYVLFTKADLIVGFREFFQDFNADQRKAVWGATFQTQSRKTQTVTAVGTEFDQLLSRTGAMLVDQMQGEADEAARIAMLDLPAQMAHLRTPITTFLADVFAPSKATSRTILRGFYFASGTQEGTPFDQALGAIQRLGDGASVAGKAFAAGFLSGKGKSFFLHDLLRKVIFEERHWVGYSRRAMIWTAVLRSFAMMLITVAFGGALAFFGYAYWQNATLLAATQERLTTYQASAAGEIGRTLISDPDLRSVLPLLNDLRTAPAGFEDGAQPEPWEDAGLSQKSRVHAAAVQAYSNGLEQMLRPRLILGLENSFPFWDQDNALAEMFEGLKVYMLLGGQGARSDDAAIRRYYNHLWAAEFGEGSPAQSALVAHLDAMLELDDSRASLVGIQADTVTLARNALSRATLPDLAYALVRNDPDAARLAGWSPVTAGGGAVQWRAGADAAEVPGIFTANGFQSYVVPKLNAVGDRLQQDQWVLGLPGSALQTSTLPPRVQDLYARDFVAHWQGVLEQIALAPIVQDPPRYVTLAALAEPETSGLMRLLDGVSAQTSLMRAIPQVEEAFAPWVAAVSGGIGTRPIDEVLAHLQNAHRVMSGSAAPDPAQVAAALDPLKSLGLLLPPVLERLVSDADAQIRRRMIPPDLAQMQDALTQTVTAMCTEQIAPLYPFVPTGQSVSLESFASFFGPNGVMERYFDTYLQPHVMLDATPLRAHPDSPLADILSPQLLDAFEQGARIREAFFPVGPTPQVDLIVQHVDSTPDVASARLVINDMLIETVKGDVPVLVRWPGPGRGVLLSLLPEDAAGTLGFSGSPWDVMRLLQEAAGRSVQGDRLRATFVLGPRQITYELRARVPRHPFALRALTAFSCPDRVER